MRACLSLFAVCHSLSDKLLKIWFAPPHFTTDAEEDERGLPRRNAATTIDTATAKEDVKDFDVPEKESDRV